MQVKTAETIDADGWLHTGDLATMNEKGYVNIVGRVKEMAIRGGENLFPAEIEALLICNTTRRYYVQLRTKGVEGVGIGTNYRVNPISKNQFTELRNSFSVKRLGDSRPGNGKKMANERARVLAESSGFCFLKCFCSIPFWMSRERV
jgi:hypothetical protein